MSVHHLPPRGAKALTVMATDGVSVGGFVFGDQDTGCEHSADGDLVITRGQSDGRRRVVTTFPPGTWVLAAWVLGVGADGRAQLEDVEWARPQVTGDRAAVDAAVVADRGWFTDNPSATSYLRPARPGEWSARRVGEPPTTGAELLVEVRRIVPGLFSREPVWAVPLDLQDHSSPHQPTAQENE